MKTDINTFIENHKYINYCEAVIHPSGEVEYARPSHVECLIRIYGKPRDIINSEMPIFDAPIIWLSEKTGCIPVYTVGFYMSENLKDKITQEQKESLLKLIAAKLVSNLNMYSI